MRGHAWAAVVLTAVLAVAACAEGRVLVVGHRGAPSWRVEETLAGYELAASLGADFLETDLCMTKDRVPVCRHECELSETTDVAEREEFADLYRARAVPSLRRRSGRTAAEGGWYTEDFTLAQLRTLRTRERLPGDVRSHAFDGLYGIATLEEYLSLVAALSAAPSEPPTVASARAAPGTPLGLYIETKTPTHFRAVNLPVEELLVDALRDAGLEDRCKAAYEVHYPSDVEAWVEACGVILQSFEDNLRVQIAQSHPHYPVIQLLGQADEEQQGSEGVLYGDLMTDEGLAGLAEWATGIGPSKTSLLRYNRTSATAPTEESDESGEEESCAGVAFEYSSTGLLERAQANGLLVHPYTFRKEAYYLDCAFDNDMQLELAAFFELGVDGVFTDSVDTAVDVRDRMYPDSGSYVATLVLSLYVLTGLTCVVYVVFMAGAFAAWVRSKLAARSSVVVIHDSDDAPDGQ